MIFDDPLFWIAALASLAVLAVLIIGVLGFAKGGEFNRKHGNRLMRYRVYAQCVAVAAIVLFAWMRTSGA